MLQRSDSRLSQGPRRFLGPRGTDGQIIVFYLVFIIPMALLMFSIYNIGQLTNEKMRLQNAADNAAYSAAVWEARYMNLDAYISRAMVANYDTMAMLLSLWSVADSWDGFIGILKFVVQFIPYVGEALKGVLTPVPEVLHQANHFLAVGLGGGKKGKAMLYVMEMYTKILSYSQEALYFLSQGGRTSVIQSIAWGVDKKIQYLGLAEILNAVSLNSRIKWDKLNSANQFDESKALRQTITRSLDEISRGENFRDAGSSLFDPINNTVLLPFKALCKIITLGSGTVGISIGPLGYDVKDFDEVTGKIGGPGECNDGCDEDQIVQNDKLYQHDFAGVSLDLCVVGIKVGHHSDDAWNTGGSKTISHGSLSVAPPHLVDDVETTGTDHGAWQDVKNFTDNGIDCSSIGADLSGITSGGNLADNCKSSTNSTCGFTNPLTGPLLTQHVQDGSMSQAEFTQACRDSLCSPSNVPQGQTCEQAVPDLDQRLKAADTCGQILAPGGSPTMGGTNFGGTSAGSGSGPCQTVYIYDTPLNEVQMTWFVRDTDIDQSLDGRRIQGPTVFVYFEKPAANLPLFVGTNIYPQPLTLGVYSFAKVYYTRRPGDTAASPGSGNKRIEGKETLFNPFWAARLELPKPFGSNLLFH
jgi:hypothetical protein